MNRRKLGGRLRRLPRIISLSCNQAVPICIHSPSAGPGNTLVTLEFFDRGQKTEIVLTQTGFPSEAARLAHEKGWNRCLDGIAQLLAAQK